MYYNSPLHATLPDAVPMGSYGTPHAGRGLVSSGSAAPPAAHLGDDTTGAATMGYWQKFAVLSGINFVLLWLFIKEFGIALIISGILGAVEAAVT
jgi:hypothetical protein